MENILPRMGRFSEKPGSYEQVFRVKRSVISPGETVEVEQFITGYGDIKSSKISFYPSDDVFDRDSSYVLSSLKLTESGYTFGGLKQAIEDTGLVLILRGFECASTKEDTLFVDMNAGPVRQILTETKQVEAPFKYHLTTLKTINPGVYSLEFGFTYFNGEIWKASNKSIEFKVQNFFERNDVVIGCVALAATISAIIRFIVIPVGGWLLDHWWIFLI